LEIFLSDLAKSKGAQFAVVRAKGLAMNALYKFAEVFPPLFAACRQALVELKAEAEAAERRLFTPFGLPHEKTPVSSRVAALETQITNWEQSVNALRQRSEFMAHPSALSQIVEFFS